MKGNTLRVITRMQDVRGGDNAASFIDPSLGIICPSTATSRVQGGTRHARAVVDMGHEPPCLLPLFMLQGQFLKTTSTSILDYTIILQASFVLVVFSLFFFLVFFLLLQIVYGPLELLELIERLLWIRDFRKLQCGCDYFRLVGCLLHVLDRCVDLVFLFILFLHSHHPSYSSLMLVQGTLS